MEKNKNIVPLHEKDLENEFDFLSFKYNRFFTHSCNLIPNISKEKIEIEIIDKKEFIKKGIIYIFIINEKILKIGQSIGDIKSRIGSYNCGKIEYRINGTASTTNYFILQSILKINKIVKVYSYQPDAPEISVFGKKIRTNLPITKAVERKLIQEFEKEFGRKPIGITQK